MIIILVIKDLNGYLMYPKVFLDYMGRHRDYGPVRTLPTHNFFYGMKPGEEISAEIDPGKTLEIRLLLEPLVQQPRFLYAQFMTARICISMRMERK